MTGNLSQGALKIPKRFQVQVAPLTPRFVNYLRVPVRGGGDTLPFSVGELSDEDAARLWDHWKTEWLAHVKKRREAGV